MVTYGFACLSLETVKKQKVNFFIFWNSDEELSSDKLTATSVEKGMNDLTDGVRYNIPTLNFVFAFKKYRLKNA